MILTFLDFIEKLCQLRIKVFHMLRRFSECRIVSVDMLLSFVHYPLNSFPPQPGPFCVTRMCYTCVTLHSCFSFV